ncbi:MAG: hypothetical protein ABIA47_01950 [bacterium]
MNTTEIVYACYQVVCGIVTTDRTRRSVTGSVMLQKLIGNRIGRALGSGASPVPGQVIDKIRVAVMSPRSDSVYSIKISGIPGKDSPITMTMTINLRKKTISRVR